MRIGLIDVDGHNYPNYALMRIASYHKSIGDKVEWLDPFSHYNKVYKSKIFTFTPDYEGFIDAGEIECGGTGYDITKKLPIKIDTHIGLDYTLYPQHKFSIQFYSRGCIRSCPFCLVRQKEGDIHSVQPMPLNPQGEWIEVLDNNFFASPNWESAIADLKKTKQPIKFHGVDVRIMEKEHAQALNSLTLKGMVHIAWDLPKIDLTKKLKAVLKYIKPYKLCCYVIVGYNSTIEEDLYRLRTLKELKILPFVQPYRDYENKRKPTQYEKDIARWANRAWLFRSIDFNDYEPRKNFKCIEYLRNR